MALTFVYGNSGNGKSEYMYQKIADMAEHAPYQHYFVVVPEQFTMSAQRSLVEHSASGVILNIDVVSFERLAYRIFDELGVHRTVMEETGKSLVLRRIVEENENDLTILRHSLTRMGYISELKSVLSELMQYDISPDDLEDLIAGLDEESSLCCKLRDILLIYRSFDDYLEKDYVTAEQVLDLLADVAEDSSLLRGAVLCFDGYTGFTPVQMILIRKLMPIVSDLYVTVTLDTREPLYAPARMEDLFFMSHKMINALVNAARDVSCEISEPVRIDDHKMSRFSENPALSHLERNLFRTSGLVYEGSVKDPIHTVCLYSPKEELRYAASTIRSLVRSRGYHYRDCAVICSEVETYENYAETIFSRFDIPVFVDRKLDILYHPLTELIRAVLDIAETDYSLESVFRYLRTGLCGFEAWEVDLLENYCIEKGIRGASKWKNRFTKLPDDHGRLRRTEDANGEELERVNALRAKFFKQTEAAFRAVRRKDSSVTERTEALYLLLTDLCVEKQVQSETKSFEQSGEELSAQISRQIYKIVIDLMDKMVDLLGDEILPVTEYAQILEAGFVSAKVGAIPPGNDCVIVGDIERTRLDHIKVLFFLGVNDELIPKKRQSQSILSEYDRGVMEDHRVELSPGEREQMFLQRFYLYLALSKPKEALYLTYSRMNSEGKACRPSYLIGVLDKMFAGLTTDEIDTRELFPFETAESSVESYLTGLILTDQNMVLDAWRTLHRWYMESESWNRKIRRLFDAHFSIYKKDHLDPDLAKSLYGNVLYNSVTRLERFEECAFAHFLEYGLKLAQRNELSFESVDMGSMFHAILEKYGCRADQAGGWDNMSEDMQDDILSEAMEEALLEFPNESLTESEGNAYVLERIRRILKSSIWAITEQIRRGDFHPEGYEVPFEGVDEVDPEEQAIKIIGFVDRLDICVENERIYVCVMDYKSGRTDLHLQNVYYGRQLQLPVYLYTAMQLLGRSYPGREIIPAGVFYFHLDDPMVQDYDDDDEIRRAVLKSLRPSGLVNAEPSVFLRMDRYLLDTHRSDVIPISLKKDGSVSATSKNAVSSDFFLDLMQYVRIIMDEDARQMADGEIEIRPYRMEDRTGCDYCRYKGICGFDTRISGYRYRDQKKIPDEEIRERIRGKLKDRPDESSGQ